MKNLICLVLLALFLSCTAVWAKKEKKPVLSADATPRTQKEWKKAQKRKDKAVEWYEKHIGNSILK